jgi:hypothetical protein
MAENAYVDFSHLTREQAAAYSGNHGRLVYRGPRQAGARGEAYPVQAGRQTRSLELLGKTSQAVQLFTNKIEATGPNGKPSKPIQDAADRGEGSLAARS